MKKILVPCDFSATSISAYRLALDVANMSGGEIHLVNVIELPVLHDTVLMPVLSFEEALMQELKEKAEKQFEKLKKKYAGDFDDIVLSVLYGNISIMLLQYIEEHDIDLVVMGTKGATGVREALIGSNAEKIVRRSPVPVLTVKKYQPGTEIKSIVFPTSLQEDHPDLVSKIKALQKFFDATLHVVYINTPANFTPDGVTRKRLNDFVKKHGLRNVTTNIYNDRYEEAGIINFAHSIDAGMIAMGTHGRKGLAHILSGSLTEDVVNHVDCPTWTYMIKRES
jgi:nucleotide-binding universal stress UspA family protein|nr:MAG: universal stress protein [Bacteroidota bacterium]